MLRRQAGEHGGGVRDADRVRGAVHAVAGRQRELRMRSKGAQSLAAEPEACRTGARILGCGCTKSAAAPVFFFLSPASYGRLTVHLPHHAHVHGQDPDAVILDDAAVACEVRLDPDVACVGVERVLHELEDCVAEGCHDECGTQAQRHGLGELPNGGGFGRHLRLERERERGRFSFLDADRDRAWRPAYD